MYLDGTDTTTVLLYRYSASHGATGLTPPARCSLCRYVTSYASDDLLRSDDLIFTSGVWERW